MTTEIKHSTKKPDFILLNIENALQVVEIKPPEHVYDDKDWERMYRYPTAISEFLEENPKEVHIIVTNATENFSMQ